MWETGSVQSVQTWYLSFVVTQQSGSEQQTRLLFSSGARNLLSRHWHGFQCWVPRLVSDQQEKHHFPSYHPHKHTHSLHCLGVCLALHPFLNLMFLACGKDWCGPFLLFPPLYLLSHFDYAKIWFLWTPWTPDSYEPHDLDQWLLTGFASAHRVSLYMKWQSRIVCAKVNKNVKHWNVLMIIYYYQVNLNTLVFILWSGTDSLHFESSVLLGHIANKKSRQPCKMTTWRVICFILYLIMSGFFA